MTLLASEPRGQECMYKIEHELGSDHAGTEAKDIHVVVLHTLVGRVDVVAHGCTNTGHFIRCNRHSHTIATDQQSTFSGH